MLRSQFLRGLAVVLALAGCGAAGRAQNGASADAGVAVHGDAEYVGQYQWNADPDIVMSVYLEGGRLYEEREGRQRRALLADPDSTGSRDRFRVVNLDSHVIFERDAAGALSGCRIVLDKSGETLVEETRIGAEGVRVSHYRAYSRAEAMVPMRDGVKLHAVILRPVDWKSGDETLPILMERTPYGAADFDSDLVNLAKPELAASGYIFVFQEIRGTFGSAGKFVMNRPIVEHATKQDIDETTDTHDTIDWLLANEVGNSGKVGVIGVSYGGFLAMMAGIGAHPAVKAISPQAPMTDGWLGDDFFHNGAFRQSYGFDYVQQMEGGRTITPGGSEDRYNFFLRMGNFEKAATAARMKDLPTAKASLTQPTYTQFWKDMAVEPWLTKVEVPTLEVGGYWDQEDMWGTQAEYGALKAYDAKHEVFLVLGPWNHGGWGRSGRKLGALDFGEGTGREYRKAIEAPFFEKYLKGRAGFDLEDTASYRTGVNRWERYSAWPPVNGFSAAKVFLEAGGKLSFSGPSSRTEAVAASYVADPRDPVPYRHRPVETTYSAGSRWGTWLAEDQRFVSGRKDLANFETSALDRDVTVTGNVTADLFAATTGSDADWVVKLIDEYPDDASGGMAGYQLMVAEEIFRGRYLHGFEKAEALAPGKVEEFRWGLNGVDHTFLKGHKMMVEVQSSWFPLYDRNPQTFVPNIMSALAKAYKAETVTIYGSPEFPSHLEFSVSK